MASRMGAGIAAAAVALGVTQLLATPLGSRADARTAVGSTIIDLTPAAAKEWAIQTFGTSDKLFLTLMVLVVILVAAALAARWETRTRPVGSAVLAAAGLAGAAAVLSRPGAGIVAILPVLAGTACGIAVLRRLTVRRPTEPDRRHALVTLGLTGAGVAAGLVGAGWSRRLHSVAPERQAFTAPPVAVPAPPIPAEVQPTGVELPSFLTPNDDFYRIDTALNVPQLSRADWRLRVHGMVDRETTYDMAALEHLPVVEKVVTLTCVSNPVGGELISNATWTGYRVRDILAAAGVHPDADMVLSTSVDGFTVGTPVEALTDGRDALLAITMNGRPLPAEHGYPARLVVPGLYGYVSATKWVVDLELTRFDRAQAYWTRLGWSERGPIKTESRIDVPRDGAEIDRGPVTFGGVAWAQNRGVRTVEVRIDDGVWQPAELGASYSADTWRLWSFPWQARDAGRHTITVRATDNTGAVQTADTAPPPPDGATGWHQVEFSVR
ncbi:MAG TPA: molybdopterin-dependent oxidoreductase [Mycobacterium sp.]|nr:molybdopterin-dependent oxidoreductase [Mycobacterium sp.]